MQISREGIVKLGVIIIVIALGTYFRVIDLGYPGFWGDEETSSIPSRSLALGNGPVFASGMEYRRALPHTYLNAISAKVFGIEKDYSYRLPSTVFGIVTLLLIFFGTLRFFGFYVALVAVVLLAFSEWHIILSRTARMYGPLLFFSMLFCFTSLTWHHSKSKNFFSLATAILSYALAIMFNFLAIVVLPILVLPSAFYKFNRSRFFISFFATVILGLLSLVYFSLYIKTPYEEIQHSKASLAVLTANEEVSSFTLLSNFSISPGDIALVFIALIVTSILSFVIIRKKLFAQYPMLLIGFIISSFGYSLFLFYGAVYGVLTSFLLLLLSIPNVSAWCNKRTQNLLVVIIFIPCLVIVSYLYKHGFETGFKAALNYPFPYLLYQLLHFPGILVLFLLAILNVLITSETDRSQYIKVLAILVLIPPFILGLIQSWAPPRYFVALYPLLIISASYGFVTWIEKIKLLQKSEWMKLSILLIIPASGALGGHGISQANSVSPASYGKNIYANHLMGIKYPDHRSHGCLVKGQLEDDDIVVAEDALQMYWYIGRVDYWLRSPSVIDSYLYLDQLELKDIYVNSRPTTREAIYRLRANTTNRIWVITSGETQQHLGHFLHEGSEQREWFEEISRSYKPVLTGRDGLSKTYCINCNLPMLISESYDLDCNV